MTARRQFFVHASRGAVLVKEGFCWPAFFFGALWAAVRGLWFPLFPALLALDTVLWFLTGYADAQHLSGLALLALATTVAYAWARGHYGNRWLREGLQRKGFLPGSWR
jgi:hypothetical protein